MHGKKERRKPVESHHCLDIITSIEIAVAEPNRPTEPAPLQIDGLFPANPLPVFPSNCHGKPGGQLARRRIDAGLGFFFRHDDTLANV